MKLLKKLCDATMADMCKKIPSLLNQALRSLWLLCGIILMAGVNASQSACMGHCRLWRQDSPSLTGKTHRPSTFTALKTLHGLEQQAGSYLG
uniref:Uncharacterized protein n=1 Tax=Romanomermis culicivorax TaxID=13658 RepID=A0A915HJI9_ROMCU